MLLGLIIYAVVLMLPLFLEDFELFTERTTNCGFAVLMLVIILMTIFISFSYIIILPYTVTIFVAYKISHADNQGYFYTIINGGD